MNEGELLFNWKVMKTTGKSIKRRNGHTCEYFPSIQKMILFGGTGTREEYFLLDLKTLQWDVKKAPIILQYLSTVCLDKNDEGGTVILYGGMKHGYDFNKNVFEVHVSSEDEKWNERKLEHITKKNSPNGRWGHSSFIHVGDNSSTLIIYGGWNLSSYHGDVWAYDLNKGTWELKNDGSTDSPGKRWNYSAVCLKKHEKILLFGGMGQSSIYYNDLWELSLKTYKWNKIEFKNQRNIMARSDARMFFLHDRFGNEITERIFLSSGSYRYGELDQHSEEERTNFYYLDLRQREWKTIHTSSEVPNSGTDGMDDVKSFNSNFFVQHEDKLFLVGGYYINVKEKGQYSYQVALEDEQAFLFSKIPAQFLKGSLSVQVMEDLKERVEFLTERFMTYQEVEEADTICMKGILTNFRVLKVLLM